MRRLRSVGFWILVAWGGGIWLYGVVDRLRDAEDAGPIWRLLFLAVAGGAGLEILFLIIRRQMILRLAKRVIQRDPESVEPDPETMTPADRWFESFGNWTGVVLLVVMLALSVGAYAFDWFDPLAPPAFFLGFVVVWLGVGGHRFEKSDSSASRT